MALTAESKRIILSALQNHRGDDLERAKRAFAGLSREVMQGQYGQSGKTRQQIIDEYQSHVDAVQRAIAEVSKS